jgi:hypothetical protein
MPGGKDPVTGKDVNDEDFYYSIRQEGGGWAKNLRRSHPFL